MATIDITTLASVKNYLGISNALSDSILSQLITAESSNFLFLTRWSTFYPTTVTRQLDGTNTDVLMLTDRPITAISLLQIGALTVPQSTGYPNNGFMFDTWGRVTLVNGGGYGYGYYPNLSGGWGYSGVFPRARKNITITYTYGFAAVAVTNEIQNIPASTATVNPANGPFFSDQGVTYVVGGGTLTYITGVPVHGQYTRNSNGQYIFATADIGLQVFINYNYLSILPAIQQCVNEMVGYKYGMRGSLSVKQETLVGQAITTRIMDYPDFICRTLRRYERKYGGTANASAGW